MAKDYKTEVHSGIQSTKGTFLSFLIGLFSLGFVGGMGDALLTGRQMQKRLFVRAMGQGLTLMAM